MNSRAIMGFLDVLNHILVANLLFHLHSLVRRVTMVNSMVWETFVSLKTSMEQTLRLDLQKLRFSEDSKRCLSDCVEHFLLAFLHSGWKGVLRAIQGDHEVFNNTLKLPHWASKKPCCRLARGSSVPEPAG